MPAKNKIRESWSGRFGFILAAVGSAVGLGNLWKFPYITWQNGGGAFVFIYLVCIVAVGLPIMISEIVLGKLSRQDPFGTFKKLDRVKSPFRFLGLLGIASSFILLSYYSVIAGWSIEYQIKSYQNKFEKVALSDVRRILAKEETATGAQVQREPADLETIHQTILRSKKETSLAIKKKAFLEALTLPLPAETEAALLKDIPVLKSHDRRSSAQMDLIISDILKTSANKNSGEEPGSYQKIMKWYDHFYAQKKNAPKFQEWLQKAFLPIYSSSSFSEFTQNKGKMLLWHSIIMLIVCFITMGGIKKGIEKVSKYGMSFLLLIISVLMVNSLLFDEQGRGFQFLVMGDPQRFRFESIMEALGHAFFTLSIGYGVMITYGSYLDKKENAIGGAVAITFMDTAISIMACLVIFPIIFVHGMKPTGGGIGILFTTLPLEFFKFSGGQYFSILFYVLVLVAAVTSAISLLEVVVTFFKDQLRMKRVLAVVSATILIYLAGIPSAFSLGFLGVTDSIVSNVLMPLGGLMIAVFAGYRINIKPIEEEFTRNGYSMKMFRLFKISIRYISPVLLVFVFISLIYKIV